MLSPDERAGAALKLRVLQADLVTLSVVETTAQDTLFATERAFAQALKSMRDAHAAFERAQSDRNEMRREIDNTRRAIEVGDRAALGKFDIGMLARVQALVAQDLAGTVASSIVTDNEITVADDVEISTVYVPSDSFAETDTEEQPAPPSSRSPSVPPAITHSPRPAHRRRHETISAIKHLHTELVFKIFHTAAELFVESDRKSVLSIAVSCHVGYHSVIPVLYRTLLMTRGRGDLAMRVFRVRVNPAVKNSMLRVPPSERLCRLVRRLCITETPSGFSATHIRRLTGLHTLYDSALIEPLLNLALVPTLRHVCEWTERWPQALPRAVTHLTLFYPLKPLLEPHLTSAKVYLATKLPECLTNLAISFSDSLASHDYAIQMVVNILWHAFKHKSLRHVVIRLSQNAASRTNQDLVWRAINTLPVQHRAKAEIWLDLRQGSNEGQMLPAISDAVAGRTPFTETPGIWYARLLEAQRAEPEDTRESLQRVRGRGQRR